MADKVTCPYCGTEMWSWTYPTAMKWFCAYRCHCGAFAPHGEAAETKAEAEKSAYEAALRRSELPNRVLTLVEAIRSEEPCVFIEDIDKKKIVAGIIKGCNLEQVRVYIAGRVSKLLVLRKEYGKRWRCWLRKPTIEERKAVKWE